MNKSIIFWGTHHDEKGNAADVCSLLFNENKIIRKAAKDLKPKNFNFGERVRTELVIVTDCFELEIIDELEGEIRKYMVSGDTRIIYLYFSETEPKYLQCKYHIVECIPDEREPVQLSEAFEKCSPENIHLLQSQKLVEI